MRRTTLHSRYLRSAPTGESGPGGGGGAPAGDGGQSAGASSAEPPAAPAAPPTAPAAPVVPPSAQVAGQPATPDPDKAETVENLPQWAQKIITEARKDAGDARIAAKTAAEAAKAELAQVFGKALGLVKSDEPVDPAKLTSDLADSRTETRDVKTRLAVYEISPEGVNVPLLMQLTPFTNALRDVEPDNVEAIKAAVDKAVIDFPFVKTQAAPAPQAGASGADFTGGTGGGNGQLTRAQLAGMSAADIAKAMKEGRTDALLKGHNR